MDSNIRLFPERSVRAWSEFEACLLNIVRVSGKTSAFADELACRLKPMFELLFAFHVKASPVDAATLNPALHALLNQLLSERLYAEIATLEALGYS